MVSTKLGDLPFHVRASSPHTTEWEAPPEGALTITAISSRCGALASIQNCMSSGGMCRLSVKIAAICSLTDTSSWATNPRS
eukprot:scaffold2200_cov413-Prasinococcus_capsulatus_cf.AAC.6